MKRYTKEQREQAEKIGLTYDVIFHRIRTGWSDEDAITLPLGTSVKNPIVNGQRLTDEQVKYMEDNDMTLEIVRNRIYRGWDFQKAITTPHTRDRNYVKYAGKAVKRQDLDDARAKGVSEYTLKKYVKKGMHVKDIVKMYLSKKRLATAEQLAIAEKNGISSKTVYKRLHRGFDIDKAITEPTGRFKNQERMTYAEQLQMLGRMKYLNRVKDDNYNPIMLKRLNLTWDDVTEIPVEIENRYVKDELGWNRVDWVRKGN